MSDKQSFYSLKRILSKNAQYNLIYGERSNGKTYAGLEYALEKYVKTGRQSAYIRRWGEDIVGKRGSMLCDGIVSNGLVSKLTNGLWTGVYYYASKWYLCCTDPDGQRITDDKPFMFGFAISQMEHDKSTTYANVYDIILDEFISRMGYLDNEPVLFANVVSTIFRGKPRDECRVFMFGNTVNKYCPYFNEFGLKNVRKQKQGTIDVYKMGELGLTIAVEYCSATKGGKQSDVFFAFDNPKMNMITKGEWEIDIYPHCPCRFRPKDVLFTYFIKFDGDVLQCEIVSVDKKWFTYIHIKTTELKDEDNDLIYTTDYDPRPNYRRNICKPIDELDRKIAYFYKADKVFYQDNEVGEIVRNYLIWCGKISR